MDKRRTKARQCSQTGRNLLYRSRWWRIQRNSQEREEKTGKTYDSNHAVQKTKKVTAKPKIASEKNSNTVYGCIVEPHESTRQRLESSQPKKSRRPHGTQRIYFDVALQLGTQVHPDATSEKKNPDAKAAVDKDEVILEAQRDKRKVHFAPLMDICHLKKCGVGTQITEVQRQSRAPVTL